MGGAYRQDRQDTSETPVVAITLLSAYQKVLDQRNRIHFISPLPPLPPLPPPSPPPLWVSLAIRRSKHYPLQRPETPTDFDRGKLSTDPNNTAWAKSTTSFGHKMLSKQGWKPGDFLGAENASHASHYTAANASHIKVMLREENLGIGAKIGTQNAETFGLSMFSGLLGRLNGKEEDRAVIQKKEETLRDVQLKLKYGNMNFVSGGMLVGDKMQEVKTDLGHLKDGGVATVQESKKRKAGSDGSEEDEKSAKKRRKAEEKEKKKKEKKANGTAAAIKEMKRQRKLEAGSDIPPTSKESPEQEADSSSTTSSSSEDEQESKRGKKAQRKTSRSPKRSSSSSDAKDAEKARLKEEKRARKEERRKRKEEKRAKRAAKALKSSSTIITKTTTTQPGSTTESETQSGTSTPTFLGGRQAVRHRYIMQKRMAGASAQALQEIFMMKPQVAS